VAVAFTPCRASLSPRSPHKTPFGDPSDAIVVGTLEGKQVAFLARHARPSHSARRNQLRANVYALKLLGVERIISVSAVGSLKKISARRILVATNSLTAQRRVSTFSATVSSPRHFRQANLRASLPYSRR